MFLSLLTSQIIKIWMLIFVRLYQYIKVQKKKIQTNLNSVRTAGNAATTLSLYTYETTLKNDLHELRDNGLFGNTFREGLSQLNLTASQKEKKKQF